MTPEQITDIIRYALFVALEISAPMLITAMVVGFVISLFQGLTQIQEMTLTFVPKLLVFSGILAVFFPWMLKTMIKYTHHILVDQWENLISLVQYAQ
ncbi:MAG: EscS/YscS/HrcS family type secretion system export apparatus protein [Chlamydiales bacterium]|jgi:flagellar biosynthetic protein FliQ|nr:EscS/YscS/HrcS family type secretion system export apparatus protein [Chlamydiales bacterium]